MTDLTDLQKKLLYSMIVAGKSATFADRVMSRLFGDGSRLPFDWLKWVRSAEMLGPVLRHARAGNYRKLERGFSELIDAKIDLAVAMPADLERIHGIGPKTSRFFILWTRPGEKYAALDTHVLKWLRFIGHPAPKSTPQNSKRYAELEKIFLDEAEVRSLTARELDALIWDFCSSRSSRVALNIWPTALQRIVRPGDWPAQKAPSLSLGRLPAK